MQTLLLSTASKALPDHQLASLKATCSGEAKTYRLLNNGYKVIANKVPIRVYRFFQIKYHKP